MATGRFRFGLYEFDAAKCELRREGNLVRLQAQPAQVLSCLVDHAGQVVTREELRQAIWGGETFVDFDRGLNFCMSQVRAALKDDSAEPTYIRTLPKQGYQFIAPVERIAEPPQTAHVSVLPLTQNRQRKRMRALALAAAMLGGLVIVTAAASYWWRARPAAASLPTVAVARFDNETGNPDMARFSDALTDDVVERLTSDGKDHFAVIGNAQILRQPRDQRDLKTIATSLHGDYAVLGQVQSDGAQVRVLAHLIRLSDQTHIWVMRIDRPAPASLATQSEIARMIGAEFTARLSADPEHAASFPSGSH